MSDHRSDHLDGNAAAGALREIFALDVTAAVGRCVGCGAVSVMAQARYYADAPGHVLRCAYCDAVLLRLVTSEDRSWLDLRGIAYLQLSRTELV